MTQRTQELLAQLDTRTNALSTTLEQAANIGNQIFALIAQNAQVAPAYIALLQRATTEALQLVEPKIRAHVFAVYADYYTDEDLEALLAFYASPVGHKLLAAERELGPRLISPIARLVEQACDERINALEAQYEAGAQPS